jgi:hypothetical protein
MQLYNQLSLLGTFNMADTTSTTITPHGEKNTIEHLDHVQLHKKVDTESLKSVEDEKVCESVMF